MGSMHVVATFVAREGHEEDLRSVLSALVEPTHSEDGCILYELHRNRQNPALFIFIEEWRDEASLERHLASDHVRRALSEVPALLATAPEIVRLERVSR